LLRTPGHSVAIIITLALGIGATATIYSVVSGVLLRPLPFPDQDLLVMLWQQAPGVGIEKDWFSPAQYFDLREVSGFEEVALYGGYGATLSGTDAGVERVGVLFCSSSLFDVLGLATIEGRPLLTEDDVPGTKQKAVISHHLYTQRFGADPDVVGDNITLDGVSIEVVGVLEAVPLNAELLPTLLQIPVFDLLISYPIEDPQKTGHGTENFNVIAKLRPQAATPQLDRELLSLAARFSEDEDSLGAGLEPGGEYHIGVVPLLDQVVGDVRSPLLVLLGATGLLLAIACVNGANLLLTRAATRSRDIAIRVALGAHRRRVFSQSMIASLLLAAAGGVGGVALAVAGVRGLHLRCAAPASSRPRYWPKPVRCCRPARYGGVAAPAIW
jgi:predicted permease